MNDAKLYQSSNSLQKRDALICLKENADRIRWKKNCRVLDIGCADGTVTKYLKYYIPEGFTKLVGCDISERMVRFASNHNRDNRTSFMVFNVEGDLPVEMKGNFDHVFSFYTLHWIKKQEKAFRNIYDLLSENGDCLLLFLQQMPIFDIYQILASRIKWAKWLFDVERYISPYHNIPNPQIEIRQMMEKMGFKNIDVRCKPTVYTFRDVNILRESLKAVNPFKIPKNLLEDFINDLMEIVEETCLIEKKNDSVYITFNYKLLLVYASK